MSKLTANLSTEDRKMLNKIFLRSFTVFASCAGGSVKQGADGWLYSMMPALNRFYKDNPEKRANAMSRHTTWYNITQNVGTFAMGLVASMEKENSQHETLIPSLSTVSRSRSWAPYRVSAMPFSGDVCAS